LIDDKLIFKQRTLKKKASIAGIGLFTGSKVSLTLNPAEENHGIVFQRVDLPNKPKILARLDHVKETPRCTILGDEKINIQTVEHLLSALSAYEIDNLLIEITGPEVPVCDGSSRAFVDLIEQTGILLQKKKRRVIAFTKPIYWSQKEVHIVALPSTDFRISYLLHYPRNEMLKSQFYSTSIDSSIYKEEISTSRTFSVYEEIEPLLEKGFIKGGGLNNAVIIKDNKVLNPEGLRFPEEMARHKILDLIGDLSLLGGKILGHIIAIRSGHFSNISFAKEVLTKLEMEEKK
jgi:UDP-3-O-[3-hydroxymyristoyl] N-acetylglucosamine deacetylase